MKKFPLVFGLVFITINLMFAQEKPKPKEKDKPPTQKEMEDLMKEAQKELDNLSEEDKKMMKEMGIKIPSMKDVPQVTDQQLADAAEEDGKVIPSKKTDLIARIPKKVMSKAEVASYIKTTNTSIASIIKPKSKELAEKAMLQFKNDPHYGAMIASSANGMWMMGLKEPAIYLMGKAAEVLPNADNYNNYSAYLTMTGAGHMAIPVLQKLNSIHKNNSTILNNLGQAWLQLGDGDKAEKYLDSAIRVYAYHPQANYTKCLILESKGKKAEAVVALKRSLKHSGTKDKIDKLSELQKDLQEKSKYYIPRSYVSTSFNLGVYTALIPKAYSMADGGAIEKEWEFFRTQLRAEKEGLDAAIRLAEKLTEQETKRIGDKATKNGEIGFAPYYFKALDRFNRYTAGNFSEFKTNSDGEKIVKYLTEWAELKQAFSDELQKEHERFNDLIKSGANVQVNCEGNVPIVNKYVSKINILNQSFNEPLVRQAVTNAYNTYYYGTAIALTDGAALGFVLGVKRTFVQTLLEMKHESYSTGCATEKEKEYKKRKLPDYDKVNCLTSSTLYVPLTGQITIRCNEMETIFNPAFIPVKASWTENFNTNNIEQASIGVTVKAVDLTLAGKFDKQGNLQSGTVSVGKNIKGVDVSVNGEFDASGFKKGSVELGIDGAIALLPTSITDAAPIDLSMKGELGVGLELGPEGITDIYVKESTTLDMAASVEADIGKEGNEALGYINEIAKGADIDIPEPKLSAGASISADNRVGVNSGYSAHSAGELSGLK